MSFDYFDSSYNESKLKKRDSAAKSALVGDRTQDLQLSDG